VVQGWSDVEGVDAVVGELLAMERGLPYDGGTAGLGEGSGVEIEGALEVFPCAHVG
jgi:hypothetical protein